jgi:hypothetical protein
MDNSVEHHYSRVRLERVKYLVQMIRENQMVAQS